MAIWLRTYGKGHSDSESGNPLSPLHRILISNTGSFICHRQDNTHHGLCYASRGALSGMRTSSMGPSQGVDPTTHRTMSRHSTTEIHLAPIGKTCYALLGTNTRGRVTLVTH